ncbi:MAG: hypothetical protein FJW26_02320 [Acidimicrobiia bacterium]|nr:hypothetical protein [Acidimicrobiia bacterium]
MGPHLGKPTGHRLGAITEAAPLEKKDTAFRVPPGQRQLSLDDHGIGRLENLTRRIHQPEKRGAVVRSANPSQTIQTRTAPVWDPAQGLYKLWVTGTDQPLRLSHDGLHWTAGPQPNRPVSHVVYDPKDADPGRRFKAALLDEGFAVSPDGIEWKKLDVPKIQSADEGNFSYDPQHGLFIHTVKRRTKFGRSVAIATSRDFENWLDYGIVFHTDELDQEEGRKRIIQRRANPALKQTEFDTPEQYSLQVYNMGVFHYEGLYVGLPSIYHLAGKVPPGWPGFDKLNLSPEIRSNVAKYGDWTGFYHIQVIASRDLRHWERVAERQPFLETSPLGAGAYDIQTIIGPSAPVLRQDELWFYYTGIKNYAYISSGSEPGYSDYYPDKGAICLAVLRRDGFVSLRADDAPGVLLTRPFGLAGKRLFLNADAGSGEARVEVLDDQNQVCATSAPITRDLVRSELTWKQGNLAGLEGRSISLRFTLRKADLFSYWLEA